MSRLELGYLICPGLSLVAVLVCFLTTCFSLTLARHYRTEAERWRTAFEDSEADLNNVVAWQGRALAFLFKHAPDLAEAEGLARRAEVIGAEGMDVPLVPIYQKDNEG